MTIVPSDYEQLLNCRRELSAAKQRAVAAEEHLKVLSGDFNTVWDAKEAAKQRAVEAERRADGRIREFTAAILHGDINHRTWLIEAADAFIAGKSLPEPAGVGRTQAAEADRDRLREIVERIAKFKLWTDVYPDCPLDPSGSGFHISAQWVVDARQALSASPAPSAAAVVRAACKLIECDSPTSYTEHFYQALHELHDAVSTYTADPGSALPAGREKT